MLERGRITQRGTYDELMAADGPFRRLATTLAGADVRRCLAAGPPSLFSAVTDPRRSHAVAG